MVSAACVQFAPVTGDKTGNAEKMRQWIRKVKDRHYDIDFILFPELALNGCDAEREEFFAMAEEPGAGEACRFLAEAAAEAGVYIAYGYAERSGDVCFNSLLMLDRNGEVAANYRKIHPLPAEKKWCTPGDSFVVAQTDFGRVGMLICSDTFFPEAAASLGNMGADILAVATNWEDPHLYDWDITTRARAFDNTLYLMGANRVGQDRANSFSGHSRILDPVGLPLASLDRPEEGYVHAVLDLVERARLQNSYYRHFRDRRPEIYRL